MSRARIGQLELVIDQDSAQAPFAQLVTQVVEAIADGRVAAGTRLPSVRALAGELELATNTVAKAYRTLEAEGHVETRGRNGTVVLGADSPDAVALRTADLVAVAKAAGLWGWRRRSVCCDGRGRSRPDDRLFRPSPSPPRKGLWCGAGVLRDVPSRWWRP